MSDMAADYATAELSELEVAALVGLASLGWNVPVTDLAAFCAGYTNRGTVTDGETRVALFTLDGIGWASPVNNEPLTDAAWYITEQGRKALAG